VRVRVQEIDGNKEDEGSNLDGTPLFLSW